MREKKPKEKPDINECAERKLSQKSMSVKELRDYLLKRGYEKTEVDRVIDTLKDFGYLDDARFACEFLIFDLDRGRSVKKAFFDLKQKGVSPADIQAGYDEYLDEYGEPDEHGKALSEAEKVLAASDIFPGDEIPEKIQGRIARRLFTRGYSQSMIYEILSELRNR